MFKIGLAMGQIQPF